MAAKKKETQNVMTTQAAVKNQMLLVDAGKLSQGLKTTFEGVAMVFDSIGVAADFTVPEVKPSEETVKEQVAKEPDNEAEVKAAETKTPAAEPEKEVAAMAEVVTEEAPEEQSAAPAAPSVTIDDITKIIVQKIKKNRSNNEKIGAILKTYGVSKVGDLPKTKYEAFLTDLSAI